MAENKEKKKALPKVVESQEDAQAVVDALYPNIKGAALYVVSNHQAFKEEGYAKKYAAANKMKVFTVKL